MIVISESGCPSVDNLQLRADGTSYITTLKLAGRGKSKIVNLKKPSHHEVD